MRCRASTAWPRRADRPGTKAPGSTTARHEPRPAARPPAFAGLTSTPDEFFVPKDERIASRLGAKGLGGIGGIGVAAGMSNAFFHAPGRRPRSLPMTPDRLMVP